ncbi:DNA repair protein RecN [Neoactinobaculum massilliense]|uniref:DNA repair protein RecN n=1 Tax=Neoactinobaculum massilliense TaxID=2364794 RepID=UPI000F527D36|nr:DNA repair protein RecN [Neoactinobaculum massilliense]
MIERVRITNLGVIEEAELPLGAGLTALTGETGAGKTMAITSFQLLLGAKADPSKVRVGAREATVEGTFVIDPDHPVVARVREAGGSVDVEDGRAVLLAARVVPATGRSRAFLGGRSVPTALLNEVTSQLVTIHGQADQLRLAGPAQQRAALDAYGTEIRRKIEKWAAAYSAYTTAQDKLDAFNASVAKAAERRLAARALLDKIDAVAPEEGEDEALRAEARELEGAEDRYDALSAAASALTGSDVEEQPAAATIAAALEKLSGVDSTAGLRERLESVAAEVTDIGAELADLAAHNEAQPERLAAIYARRQALAGLRKDIGMDIPEALAAAERARADLAALGDPEETRQQLEAELAAADASMHAAGAALTAARTAAATALAQAVEAELPALSLPDAHFDIALTPTEPGPSGMDSVTFRLASHRGAPLAPLAKSASGGELSRIMLALEVALAARSGHAHQTLIFDEVDAGVGGRAALAVGARLARLAKVNQAIVVTHLAQVAAHASTHAVVVKKTTKGMAKTAVHEVTGEARLEELARMLAGTDTTLGRAHAAELLAEVSVAR